MSNDIDMHLIADDAFCGACDDWKACYAPHLENAEVRYEVDEAERIHLHIKSREVEYSRSSLVVSTSDQANMALTHDAEYWTTVVRNRMANIGRLFDARVNVMTKKLAAQQQSHKEYQSNQQWGAF